MTTVPTHRAYDFPVLAYDPADVAIGASFGNEGCFIRTDTRAGLDHLWVAGTGDWFFGRVQVHLLSQGETIPQTGALFEPAAMGASFKHGELQAELRAFVAPGREARAYLWLQARNTGWTPQSVIVQVRGLLPATPSTMHRQQPAPADIERRFSRLASGCLFQNWQHFGYLRVSDTAGERFLVVTASTSTEPQFVDETAFTFEETLELQPGDLRNLWLCLEATGTEEPALPPPDAPSAYAAAVAQAGANARLVDVGTPSALINAGVYYGKSNTRQVCHSFMHGDGFTNAPPGSIVVTRDAAWFAFGANYFFPEFCRRMFDTLTELTPYENGKIAEYLNLDTTPVFKEDYGLNIADPTPLYLLGIHHHAAVTGDLAWLRRVWSVVRGATNYLLSQVQDDLIVCTSRKTNPGQGVAGWRNVIKYSMSGALTELQAECTAAVLASAAMARALGEADDAKLFDARAAAMRQALLDRLWDGERQRFRLGLLPEDPDGPYGREDTSDQLFPVLFGLADEGRAQTTVRNLLRPEYHVAHGLRTMPTDDPVYHPSKEWGLLGGVWPNAIAWAVVAMAPYAPEKAAKLAEIIARPLFMDRPRLAGAIVPGEFPEFFDGEACVSKGMAMSPWMPPTYVWLVVEGLLGFKADLESFSLTPHLPPTWRAAFIRNLLYHGQRLSLLVTPEAVFTTHAPAQCDRPVHRCEDITDQYTDSLDLIVMRQGASVAAWCLPTAIETFALPGPLAGLKPGELRILGSFTPAAN